MKFVGTIFIIVITAQVGRCVAVPREQLQNEDTYKENMSMQSKHHPREKRFIQYIALVSELLSIAEFTYGLFNGPDNKEQIESIHLHLQKIEENFESSAIAMNNVINQLKWQEAASIYGHDIQRLKFLLHELNSELTVQPNGTLTPETIAKRWANAVLSYTPDGIQEVLYNFNDMVCGTSHLFSQQPLLSVYIDTLDKSDMEFHSKVDEIQDFVISMQLSGYLAWAIALNVNGRHNEVPKIQQLGIERLEYQQGLMDSLVTNFTYRPEFTDTPTRPSATDRPTRPRDKIIKLFKGLKNKFHKN